MPGTVAEGSYVCCFAVSLALGFVMAPRTVTLLRNLQKGRNPIRSCMSNAHITKKKGTPSMGGIIILLPCIVATAIFGDLQYWDIWVILAALAPSAVLGGVDDYLKFSSKNPRGMCAKTKIVCQLLITSVILFMLSRVPVDLTSTYIFSRTPIHLGWLYIPFACAVIIGSSNAVNLTDGLDGLAIVPIMTSATILGIVGHLLSPADGTSNTVLFCTALVGSSLSFLWFNAHPAKIFMGDLGSLPIGAVLGLVSIMLKCEIIFAIAGSVFVLEALSSMAQVAYSKLTGGRRLFLIAPLHHHFEKMGLEEPTIVARMWVVAIISLVMSLSMVAYTYNQ
ncbi:MAG: phospho-N-acetylmuramoyl-pentapeptide-transferase [Anaplasma sp.]